MTGAAEQNIIRFIENNQLVVKGDKLLIALSGGADSLFALWFFQKFKSKFKIELSALHVNHSLRSKESDDDELFCKSFCEKNKIEFNSVKVDVKKTASENKESIEEAARNLRYQKLDEFALKVNATKIVTGHNLNDNTETILLNLFRGTGLSGVSGIPIIRQNIIRPLLSTSKEDIIKVLKTNNIRYRIDSSNLENDYTRNYLRNEIIPLIKDKINPSVDLNLLKFSEIVRESNLVLNSLAADIEKRHIKQSENGIEISDLIVSANNEKYFSIAVRKSIEDNFDSVPTYNDILQLRTLFTLQVGSIMNISEKLVAIRERTLVHIFRETENINDETIYELNLNKQLTVNGKTFYAEIVENRDQHLTSENNIEYINGDFLTFPLIIRKWKHGDKFQPLGLRGTKKVSDFLTESKVNSLERKDSLVLINQNKIIWVVAKRIDDSVKINKETKRIVKLCLE